MQLVGHYPNLNPPRYDVDGGTFPGVSGEHNTIRLFNLAFFIDRYRLISLVVHHQHIQSLGYTLGAEEGPASLGVMPNASPLV